MKHYFFKKFAYEFEMTRVLWYAPTGGSDFAEVAHITAQINRETDEEWYHAWCCDADKLYHEAMEGASDVRRGKMLLRASRYYQAAEFFLHPSDKRKLASYEQSVKAFYEGLDCLRVPYEIRLVTYREKPMRTVYFPSQAANTKGTFFVCGGFDALLEELYFTTAVAALEEGYHVVLFEGPGQSHLIRYHNVPFTPDWGEVCRAVVDAYPVEGVSVGLGLSLGGLLMARAASVDSTLFDCVILQNYFPSVIDSFKYSMPTPLHHWVDNGFPKWMLPICDEYIRRQQFLHWQVEHAKWVFGQSNLNELLAVCRDFREPDTLTTNCLVFVAENENYYNPRQAIDFYERLSAANKHLHYSTHCRTKHTTLPKWCRLSE